MNELANQNIAKHVIGELAKKNMEGIYCENREAAVKAILDMIDEGASVSWGGSASLKELNILELLKEKGCSMLEYTSDEERACGSRKYAQMAVSDYFLMSANAITIKGELVNIDGASNRLSRLLHGPKHVIVVAGMNKIVRTVEDGIDRIQTTVCPQLAAAGNRKTPCAVTGICADCQSPDCMCCNIVITRHSRYDGRIKVILVGENLGI